MLTMTAPPRRLAHVVRVIASAYRHYTMASAAPAPKRHKLVGHSNFKRSNPLSDRFGIERFHHIEFWCAAARVARFSFYLSFPNLWGVT